MDDHVESDDRDDAASPAPGADAAHQAQRSPQPREPLGEVTPGSFLLLDLRSTCVEADVPLSDIDDIRAGGSKSW